MIRILIDADACPVVKIAERIAKERKIPVILFGDTNHVLSSDYADIRVIGAGADAVDFALMNESRTGDIIITQDYGVAAMGLGKGKHHLKGPSKRTLQDDEQFAASLIRLIEHIL